MSADVEHRPGCPVPHLPAGQTERCGCETDTSRPAAQTNPQTLDTLAMLVDVLEVVARHVQAAALDVHEDDRVPLLEGITTIEVGAMHLRREIDRAGGDR